MSKNKSEEMIREDLRESRIELGSSRRTDRIYSLSKSIAGHGKIFRVLTDTPEQTSDIIRVLVDDSVVVAFELDRSDSERVPEEFQIYSVEDYRKAIGSGLAEKELEISLNLAREELKILK